LLILKNENIFYKSVTFFIFLTIYKCKISYKDGEFRSKLKERKIIKYYKNNNGLNLEKIVDEYNNYIHTVIKNMNYSEFSSEDVEEIVADTFFIIWKNREKLDENKMLSSYIAGIVKNLVRERRKNNKI